MKQNNVKSKNPPHRVVLICSTLLFLIGMKPNLEAQSNKWSLSLGASIGYAPTLKYENNKTSGMLTGLFGDLQYRKIIGRIQVNSVLNGSVDKDFNDGWYGFYGALGYNAAITDKFNLPMMLAGGAATVAYNTGLFGNSGDTFVEAGPQIGVVISPYYQIYRFISLHASFQLMKGFKTSSETSVIDMNSASLGLRFTLF